METDLAERATDLSIYVRFVAVFVVGIGAIQVWQGVRDARAFKLLLAGAVTILAVLVLIEPARLLDRF